jgi:hypothetical protein
MYETSQCNAEVFESSSDTSVNATCESMTLMYETSQCNAEVFESSSDTSVNATCESMTLMYETSQCNAEVLESSSDTSVNATCESMTLMYETSQCNAEVLESSSDTSVNATCESMTLMYDEDGKLIKQKRFVCPYCENTSETQFSRHLLSLHPKCTEAEEIFLIRKFIADMGSKLSDENQKLLEGRESFIFKCCKNKGFKKHNDTVLNNHKGLFVPDRLPKNPKSNLEYQECDLCQSMITKRHLILHYELCNKKCESTLDNVIKSISGYSENTVCINMLSKLNTEKQESVDSEAVVVMSRKPRNIWSKAELGIIRAQFASFFNEMRVPRRNEVAKFASMQPLLKHRSVTSIHSKIKLLMKQHN